MEIFHKVTGNQVDTVKFRVDKHKNIPLIAFLKALGFTNETIRKYFGSSVELQESIRKHKIDSIEDNLELIYRIIRKDDRVTEEGLKNLIPSIIFNERRYNLSATGRYMLNSKLNLIDRISQSYLAEDIVNKKNQTLYKKGTYITRKIALEIQEKFNNSEIELSKIEGVDSSIYARQLQISRNQNLGERIYVAIVKV